jgi:hypothetical protein
MRYLLITFFRKPGGQIDEQVTVSKRIKTSDLQMCNVILDYNKKKLEKCVIEGKVVDSDFQKMSEYYKKIYPSLVDQLEKNNAVQG